jgi:putative ATP-dependent endonuclease of the OLD family
MATVHLTSLSLRNFRACRDTTIEFASHLTVVVGENASGKSAIIDAIRLVTFPASGRQTSWFSAERDLTRGVETGEPVTLTTRFA